MKVFIFINAFFYYSFFVLSFISNINSIYFSFTALYIFFFIVLYCLFVGIKFRCSPFHCFPCIRFPMESCFNWILLKCFVFSAAVEC